MGLFDSLKEAAGRMLLDNAVAKTVGPIVSDTFASIDGASAKLLGDDDWFRAKLSDPSYNRLPAAVQHFVDPNQWHRFVSGIKDSVFFIEDGHLRLRSEFRASVQEGVLRLIHGENWRKHAPKELQAESAAEPDTPELASESADSIPGAERERE